jgi:hypothetical protein
MIGPFFMTISQSDVKSPPIRSGICSGPERDIRGGTPQRASDGRATMDFGEPSMNLGRPLETKGLGSRRLFTSGGAIEVSR